jgi:hypothetical protein
MWFGLKGGIRYVRASLLYWNGSLGLVAYEEHHSITASHIHDVL